MAELHACPHCGNTHPKMMTPFMEPTSQIAEEATRQQAIGKKWYCELCGKTWVVQRLPFDEPTR